MLKGMSRQVLAPVGAIALTFLYLGLHPYTALLASLVWVSMGMAGGWLIESLLGDLEARFRLPLALGPGALLALGLVVLVYLSVAGQLLGLCFIVAGTGLAAALWIRKSISDEGFSLGPRLLLSLVGLALLANSKEFPNLLLPAISIVGFAAIVERFARTRYAVLSSLPAIALLLNDMLTRPAFWYWSSDDTTTLAGMGTMIIERGQVAETAGWRTGSYHWLMHAWLALWNLLSSGNVFETYQIAWPLVAAASMFASLLLCVEILTSRRLMSAGFIVTGIVTAGLVRLEWAAPQAQEPFLFAMIACCALWLSGQERNLKISRWRLWIGAVMILLLVPVLLYMLKPSLLVAYSLLLLGVFLVHLKCHQGPRLFAGLTITLSAISLGVFLMWIGGSWVSERSFISFAVSWFPRDLGWCSYSSLPGSLACVVSLQALLIVAMLLSIAVIQTTLPSRGVSVPIVLLAPLVIVYLPLRYLISSSVGSGAPSFYGLSEMTMMVIIALGVSVVWARLQTPLSLFAVIGGLSLAIHSVSRMQGVAYDSVEEILIASRVFRFLNPADGIALLLTFVIAIGVSTKTALIEPSTRAVRYLVVLFALVASLPIARLSTESAIEAVDPERLSRPSTFGPSDMEVVGDWLRDNTDSSTLLATNFLCPESRLDECRNSARRFACENNQSVPVLVSSWAFTAFSRRDFTYLSQPWQTPSSLYLKHLTATKLGSELSIDAVRELEDLGVSKYVASRAHTNPAVWLKIRSVSELTTENFVIVSLSEVVKLLTT